MEDQYKEGDKLRVINPAISNGYFNEGQVVMVERGDLRATENGVPLVQLYGHANMAFTLDQFDKIDGPVIVTNTPRPGETDAQIAARMAPREAPSLNWTGCEEGSPRPAKHITTDPKVRAFSSGATRDLDTDKLDYEGFLSPLVMKRYAEHMHRARKMPNGDMRASDNWQLGIPPDVYMKSMWRHFKDVWTTHRGYGDGTDIEAELCALLFNVNGYLHEHLKAKRALQAQ
jgi:hypothetical protein